MKIKARFRIFESNVHFLHCIFRSVPVLLCKYIRRLDHHHIPGAGRS
nr:unnamed protein product [Callosobruchus chinensis]